MACLPRGDADRGNPTRRSGDDEMEWFDARGGGLEAQGLRKPRCKTERDTSLKRR